MLLGWLVYQERKDLPQDLARQLKAAFTSDRCKAVRFTDEKCKCDGWL